MTTAIDANILIDVLGAENEFTAASVRCLDEAHHAGALIICPAAVSEVAAWFVGAAEMKSRLAEAQIALSPFDWQDLHLAGAAYAAYRKRSSAPKPRMLADFLIGAHALTHADRLATRDRGYYRTYFPKLKLVQPRT